MTHTLPADHCLLVIDVQHDFCPQGALAVEHGDDVVPIINRLMPHFQQVVATQDWHPEGHSSFFSSHAGKSAFDTITLPYGEQVLWPAHCIQNTHGAALHTELDTQAVRAIIRKGMQPELDSYSAFYENDQRTSTGLGAYLRALGIKHVYLAGLATDYCVAWSALDARKEGFEATVLEDACRAIDLNGSLAQARENMTQAGVELSHTAKLNA